MKALPPTPFARGGAVPVDPVSAPLFPQAG